MTLEHVWSLIKKSCQAWIDDYAASMGAALAIGLYLGKAGVTSGFGAAGSLVVLLVWVYYSAQTFLLGAEFTWVFAHSHGSRAGETEGSLVHVPTRDSCSEMT